MRVFLIFTISLLYGCAYIQPTLVRDGITDIKRLKDIAEKFDTKNLTLELQSSNGDVIVIYPLDSRVPWQVLTYKASDIQQLVSSTIDSISLGDTGCKTTVEAPHLSHEAHAVGLGFWEIRIKGDFYVTKSCSTFVPCRVNAEYTTDYFYLTPSSKNARYSEAIVGVILNAVVAAQNCNAVRYDND